MPRTKAFDKEVVLDKAMELFWQKGYNATSYSDLVEQLGINRQSIYDTFGDKQELYAAALDRFRCQSVQSLKRELEQYSSAQNTLRAFLQYAVINNLSDSNKKGCFMVNSTIELGPHDNKIATCALDNMTEVVDFLEDVIKKGQASGELAQKLDTRALALYFYTVLTGLKVHAKLDLPKKTYDDVLKVVFSVFEEHQTT